MTYRCLARGPRLSLGRAPNLEFVRGVAILTLAVPTKLDLGQWNLVTYYCLDGVNVPLSLCS